MSLIAWYPLNGNMNNYGIEDMDLSVSSTPSYTDGKIGKALSSGGNTTWTAEQTAKILNNNQLSICFWIKVLNTDSKAMIFGNDNMASTTNNRKFSIFQYPTANDLHLSWQNNTTDATFFSTACSGVFPTGQWTHCAVTYDNPTIKVYLNGVLYKEYTDKVSNSTSFAYSTTVTRSCAGRLMNDYRFYDHCLSPKEVREIAKGLIVHYPMDDIYSTSLVNKYSGDNAKGSAEAYSGSMITRTKMYDDVDGDYYRYTLNYTGTGTSSWAYIRFPTFSFTANKKYYYSCKVRVSTKSNTNIYFRASRVANDWATNNVAIPSADNQWHTLTVSQTIPTTFDRSGTTITSNPVLEFYTGDMKTSGTVFKIVMDIKDIQVVESDTPVPFINNSFSTNTVFDTSGYGYNAFVVDGNSPTLNNDTPVGQGSYNFASSQWIKGTNTFPMSDQGTIAFWVNSTSTTATQCIINYRNATGKGIAVFLIGGKLRFDCNETADQWTPAYTYPANEWFHVVFTKNGATEKLYINGVLKETGSKATAFANLGVMYSIGASSTGTATTVTPSGNQLLGKLADFRIYTTELSVDDIKKLYKTRISVANNGTLFCTEVIEKESGSVSFNKEGIVSLVDAYEEINLYDMKLKTLSDGSQWARVFWHNCNKGAQVFSSETEFLDTSSTYKYSKFKYLENFRSNIDNKFELMLCYPTDTTAYNRWKQTDNPATVTETSGDGTVKATGYEAISIAWSTNYWGGLLRSTSTSTYMDGSVNHSNWYYAIGCRTNYQGGMPAYGNVTTNDVEVWVRFDNIKKEKFKIYTNAVSANEIIEC